jgi:exosortase A
MAILFALGLLLVLAAYHETARSFAEVWRGSDTYAHCFFVVPIAAWLVWRRREALRRLAPRPFLPGLIAIGAVGGLWLVANAAGVLFYEQVAFALMIPALVITLFGTRFAKEIAFPLGFLLLAVPFGESLQPALMRFTAKAAVVGLRLTGVPVAVEGMYLTTPTGNWQVVEACSGLRFLISMFTLGCLFAYLHFHRRRNRVIFGVLSLIVPVLANGLRAYVMVLTGYLSGKVLGTGFDHFVIGWTVFAVVMALFFFGGSRWRDTPEPPRSAEATRDAEMRDGPSPRAAGAVAIAAIALAIAPAAFGTWSSPPASAAMPPVPAPAPHGGWNAIRTPPSGWVHGYHGAESEVRAVYEKSGALVELYLGFYRDQTQGKELIHFANVIVPREGSRWRVMAEGDTTLPLAGHPLAIHETLARSPSLRVAVWHWYWLPDEFTTSRTRAKLLQARARLVLRRDHAAVVILSSPFVDDPARARARLADFTRAMLPSIRASITAADAAK